MTSNDRKALKIVLAEPQRNTEHSFNFLKFSVFVELERKTILVVILLAIDYG